MGNPKNSVVAEHALCNCRRDFRVETDNLTRLTLLLFIVHCYAIAANAVSGLFFSTSLVTHA